MTTTFGNSEQSSLLGRTDPNIFHPASLKDIMMSSIPNMIAFGIGIIWYIIFSVILLDNDADCPGNIDGWAYWVFWTTIGIFALLVVFALLAWVGTKDGQPSGWLLPTLCGISILMIAAVLIGLIWGILGLVNYGADPRCHGLFVMDILYLCLFGLCCVAACIGAYVQRH